MNKYGSEYPSLEVRVWADYACFTRPEMKVERVTYPVPTPSAARGVLEAIFWKPEISWHVQEIWVLKPVKYFSILRNEVNSRASADTARKWERAGGIGGYDATDDRAQRHTLALYDVDYLIRAQIEKKPGVEADIAKYRDQFRRRVRDGRCFSTPYLGCREFSALFGPPDGSERPIEYTSDMGLMLYDLDYVGDRSGRGTPIFFRANVEHGVLRVPPRPTSDVGKEA
ncbi:MAG TPA: type I-C CRISPR-associated protein Cas5c [Chloroflexia bacterium]|nr:type I-C CRISPR-associated protein Cas5c [Chloroflexia bacterium]